MNRLALFLTLTLALIFGGCIDMYVDIIANTNGSFTVKRTIGMSNEMLDMMKSFGKLSGNDSVKITRKDMLDSLMNTVDSDRAVLSRLPGVMSYSISDSIGEDMGYVTAVIGVKDLASLPEIVNHLMKNKESKTSTDISAPGNFNLTVTKKNLLTELHFNVAVDTASGADQDTEMITNMFKGHGFHVRLYAADLAAPSSPIKVIPGGQDWTVPFLELAGMEPLKASTATFVLKNAK